MLAGEDQSQADQPNSLSEGPPCKSKSKSLYFLWSLMSASDRRVSQVWGPRSAGSGSWQAVEAGGMTETLGSGQPA
eukprot:1148963-Pelagomonas_calceolata.AAC.3